MQCYGAGNFPDHNIELIEVLTEACNRGVIIVNTTQCRRGAVSISYAGAKVSLTIILYNCVDKVWLTSKQNWDVWGFLAFRKRFLCILHKTFSYRLCADPEIVNFFIAIAGDSNVTSQILAIQI